jgi:hypothetical protein
MFLNNGLGKFTDATRRSLPAIADETVSADWADFDQDEDNDLLVVNRRLLNSATSSGETSYFLENNGRGEFSKRSYPGLPALPALNVYLLDANGDTMADALILNGEGVLYLQGKGKWRFSNETLRRLPRFHRFQELVFGRPGSFPGPVRHRKRTSAAGVVVAQPYRLTPGSAARLGGRPIFIARRRCPNSSTLPS